MPQNRNLYAEWKDELGQEWQRVHQEYMHRIGNLTTTAYNSELGDRSFRTKRDTEGGFAHSPFFLNKSLAKLDHWNETKIQARSKELADLAIDLWPYPQLEGNLAAGLDYIAMSIPGPGLTLLINNFRCLDCARELNRLTFLQALDLKLYKD